MNAIFIDHKEPGVRVIRLSRDNPIVEDEGFVRTDEGWESWYARWGLEEEGGEWYVYRETHVEGVDCDGRMSSYSITRCVIADLRAGPDGRWPRWEPVDGGQRDYTAEAFGY